MLHIAGRGILNPTAEDVIFTWFVRKLPSVIIKKKINSGSPRTLLFKFSLNNSMDQRDLLRRFPSLVFVENSESIMVASHLESF